MYSQFLEETRKAAEASGDSLLSGTAQRLLDQDLDSLARQGFERNVKEYEFVVTYPTLPIMKRASQEDMFGKGNFPSKQIGFYIHIPFCNYICAYCARFVKFSRSPEKEIEKYLVSLKKEIGMLSERLPSSKITSIYFGGGTPTILNEQQLESLVSALKEKFEVVQGAEFTVEGSPETLSEKKLGALLELGVNRVSFGVQSFNDRLLKMCGRGHTAQQALDAFSMCRGAGFRNVSSRSSGRDSSVRSTQPRTR
jgi:coproporphyrinogen III oxidase-like Fe-S oxidoreductase